MLGNLAVLIEAEDVKGDLLTGTGKFKDLDETRRATEAATARLKKAWSIAASASKLHTRARICEDGDHAARASALPSAVTTVTVSPGRARPSRRSTEPAKIQG